MSLCDRALCARCRTRLDDAAGCASCGQPSPRVNSARVLLADPSAHVALWRMQLGLIIQQASETNHALQVQAAEPGVGETTRTRLRALGRAIAEQVADIAAVLVPAIGDPLPPHDGVGLPRGAADYLPCLFRDWGWANGGSEENKQSRAAVHRIAGGRDLGRMLVLGAGGCRL